ncbi:MAG: metallophosphoesterase family protein [Deltaproteobacteria bacterium]|nr:metallophosphoesterase family protein [Myxococcales bacterium]MDP3212584.1 metallophosphoesterase family protein [Deltaproteobacteria bacterium]
MRRAAAPVLVEASETFALVDGALRLVVVADTHSTPHPALAGRIADVAPHRILHAGDVGDLAVLRLLSSLAPVTAVRGNIDARVTELPDVVHGAVCDGDRVLLTLLLTHIAVDRTRVRADVGRLARASGAGLVVCGHSHVPFAAHDRGLTVFNPGSVGPRRFKLPIVFGVIEVSPEGVSLRHVDCETGLPWTPTSLSQR